jgi:NAD(P)H-flavin reductase
MAPYPAAEGALGAGAMLPVPYRLARKRRETADTWTLELDPAGQDRLGPFAPGQFAMLYAFGAGEVPISVSRLPGEGGRIMHTVRDVGAVTSRLCGARRGETLGARGPFGSAWPLTEAEGGDVVVVAGGLGLPPLRPAIEHLLGRRERYGQVAVLYGGRSPAELVHRAEVERWRARPDVDVEVTVDSAGSDWRGRVGLVTTLIPKARFNSDDTVAMVVGPEVMMRFTVAALRERGVPSERIYVSLERSMKCAVGHCGHCMIGPEFVCKDGPVFPYRRVERWLRVRQL